MFTTEEPKPKAKQTSRTSAELLNEAQALENECDTQEEANGKEIDTLADLSIRAELGESAVTAAELTRRRDQLATNEARVDNLRKQIDAKRAAAAILAEREKATQEAADDIEAAKLYREGIANLEAVEVALNAAQATIATLEETRAKLARYRKLEKTADRGLEDTAARRRGFDSDDLQIPRAHATNSDYRPTADEQLRRILERVTTVKAGAVSRFNRYSERSSQRED